MEETMTRYQKQNKPRHSANLLVRLTPELHEAVHKLAESEEISASELVRILLKQIIKERMEKE